MKAWKQVLYKIWVSHTNLVTTFRSLLRFKMMAWTLVTTMRMKREDTTKKENSRPTSLKKIDGKILNKYWQTKSSNTLNKSDTMTKWDSSQ